MAISWGHSPRTSFSSSVRSSPSSSRQAWPLGWLGAVVSFQGMEPRSALENSAVSLHGNLHHRSLMSMLREVSATRPWCESMGKSTLSTHSLGSKGTYFLSCTGRFGRKPSGRFGMIPNFARPPRSARYLRTSSSVLKASTRTRAASISRSFIWMT